MTHPNENVWKAFVDGEVNAAEAARLEAHLNGCDVCQTRVDALRQRAAWVAAQFAPAQNQPTGSTVAQGRSRLEQRIEQKRMEDRSMFNKFVRQPAWIAVAIVAVLGISLAFPPVRAFATGFLKIFRVQQVQVIPVDLSQMNESAGNNSAQIEQLFSDSLTYDARGEAQPVDDAAKASELAGFTVREPAAGEEPAKLVLQPGASGSFTLDVERINLLMKEMGQEDLALSPELNGAKIDFEIPDMIATSFGTCETPAPQETDPSMPPEMPREMPVASDCLVLMQLPSPTVSAPEGLDVKRLGEAFFRVTGMSADDAKALSEKIDWSSTLILPIPVQEATVSDVSVDGAQGTLIEQKSDSPYEQFILTWVKDGILYAVTGNGDTARAIDLANSLK